MLVQALVSKLSSEALDVAVMHGLFRLDQYGGRAMRLRPGDEGMAGELWTIGGSQLG